MSDNGREPQARLTQLSRARHDVYAFLGNAFLTPPTAESLCALAAEDLRAGAQELFGAGVLEALNLYARSAGRTLESQQQAHQEFMNLFKVPGGQYMTPYESVYRDTRDVGGKPVQGLLMGQSAADVQMWYKLAAVEISDEYKDLPDHIGLELNFLVHLSGKELEFAEIDDHARLTRAWEIERDFLKAHVVSWVPRLRDKLYDKSQHAFFRAVADLLVAFTTRDLATLERVVGASSGRPLPEYEPIV